MKNLPNTYFCTVNSMIPVLGPLCLCLLLHIVAQLVAGDSQLIYTPVEDITIACGESGTQISKFDNRTWNTDINSEFFPMEQDQVGNSTSQVRKAPSSSFTGRVPYTTARLSHSEFTYTFTLTTGQKFIRLYFYHASYADFDRSKALFSVKAGGYTLLQDFNASATVDASGVETIYKEFCLNIYGGDQSLNITFIPSKAEQAYAFINGIEIVSMPTYLYYTAPQSNGPAYIGEEGNFPIGENTAMEMFYRINIGGSPVSSNQDTGMYRNWDGEDETYLDESSRNITVSPSNPSIQLKFGRIPEYSAPKEVYKTGRSIDTNKTNNRSYNLTWEFHVDSNYPYLVRLHFCEIEIFKIGGERTFVIYIGNQAVDTADIVGWSGGNGIPVYRDYVVALSDLGRQKKVSLFITLQAFQMDWTIEYNNAILNGLEILKLINSKDQQTGSSTNPKVTLLSPRTSKNSTHMLVIVAGVISSIVVFSAFGIFVFRQRQKVSGNSHSTMKLTMTPSSSSPSYLCRYFSLAEIKAATKNFHQTSVIGVGGFGNVYKGCIDGGATPVAIKRLKPESSQGAHEFKTEIELLSQLRHRHLVSLIGYCTDKGEMILVYDYMARGSLRDHLYHTNNSTLSWDQRLQICIGTAQGLQYLHGGAKGTIIHRDVKSTNILLDEKWVAKVSDFGLSKGTNDTSNTHISTLVKGSFGYLDPEYFRTQHLTPQSDVYSFGVVLCEVLCARPAVIDREDIRQASLAEWTKSCHQNGELDQIIDPILRGKIAAECLDKYTEVAISCIHDNGTERPSMTDVVRGLELALQLQRNTEGNINSIERNVQTETTSSEQSCAPNDSIKCISPTIFSEVNNPSGR
uniref:receptor-like protein kinase FERONIA isoform X2 n=1 Tax=Fragaria vesca subsp. vesca TaxID=101020 RepID=UPI0005CB08E0|nr:PREDICTED: receptor-like protein kinase FERONIA isoform X2 [Fragaria vesca subsp. vesca]